jgi:hypothetical protein
VANKRFRPGTRVTVTITSLNRIGNVDIIGIRSGGAPTFKKLCLGPEERAPAPCR